MTNVRLVVPERLRAVVDHLEDLQRLAVQGDRRAQKVLTFGERYGSGLRRMKPNKEEK